MNTRIRRLLIVLGACAAALALWAVAVPVAGVDLAVDQGGTETAVGPGLVAASSLAAGLAGWALLAVLERSAARAGRIWTIIAVTVLAISALGPLGAIGAAATSVLLGMHVVVAAVLIPGLARR
ncbi:DUF6069 family protein [Glycomyces arizonensis]|uniref:DUF6069 family protein n=1 Tax=Glycomyces arizonensis TaxID=256035 RepID=UPI0003F732A7|nr:DUF6069 family protein [Glycomyces arizonensis]